jgi:hypothetical protein
MPDYLWSKKQARYQYKNGKPVADATMGDWLQAAIENSQSRLGHLTQDLADKKINLSAWVTSMRDEIRAAHRFAFNMAHGPALTRNQLGKLGSVVRAQYKYLDAFANGIENGEVLLSSATGSRAKMYADAFWNTWQNELVSARQSKGFTEQRNILSAKGTSCAGCIRETGRGWVKIGQLSPIGSRDCKSKDRCSFQFR